MKGDSHLVKHALRGLPTWTCVFRTVLTNAPAPRRAKRDIVGRTNTGIADAEAVSDGCVGLKVQGGRGEKRIGANGECDRVQKNQEVQRETRSACTALPPSCSNSSFFVEEKALLALRPFPSHFKVRAL